MHAHLLSTVSHTALRAERESLAHFYPEPTTVHLGLGNQLEGERPRVCVVPRGWGAFVMRMRREKPDVLPRDKAEEYRQLYSGGLA
jgi:hypothetical protein